MRLNQSQQVIINASAHSIPLPGGFVHTVCTSPPYYSLRKYAGAQEVDWPAMAYRPMPGLSPIHIRPMRCALGLEPTPEAYIGHLVACFREVRRVLRDDGVAWVVMGDSYVATTRGSMGDKVGLQGGWTTQIETGEDRPDKRASGLQQGDLMMIPHRLALALQADGWLVRNDVVWAKVAPMPESVSGWRWQDDKLRRGSWRHTRAHETVLMLAKGMQYYADQERVREESQDLVGGGQPLYSEKTTKAYRAGTNQPIDYQRGSGRNPRSVLTPKPESYPGSHYAVFPRTLVSPLLQATAPTRVCPVCGAPWCPVVERTDQPAASHKGSYFDRGKTGDNGEGRVQPGERYQTTTDGHRPTCNCANPDTDPWTELREYPIPGWCLDPFAGTFTTGAVCAELGVNAIGLDISAVYLDDHAKPRIGLTPSTALDELPLFAEMEAT